MSMLIVKAVIKNTAPPLNRKVEVTCNCNATFNTKRWHSQTVNSYHEMKEKIDVAIRADRNNSIKKRLYEVDALFSGLTV